MSAERRQHERYDVQIAATLVTPVQTGKVEILDISKGGVRLKLIDAIGAQGTATVTFELADNVYGEALGRVAWSSGRGIGIQFTRINKELERFLDELGTIKPVLRTGLIRRIRNPVIELGTA